MHPTDARINTTPHYIKTPAPGAYENYATCRSWTMPDINHLTAELNPIRHLLALVGAHCILHVSGVRVNTDVSIMKYNM
jgi:hypothetical protein